MNTQGSDPSGNPSNSSVSVIQAENRADRSLLSRFFSTSAGPNSKGKSGICNLHLFYEIWFLIRLNGCVFITIGFPAGSLIIFRPNESKGEWCVQKEWDVLLCCMFSVPMENSLTLILSLTEPSRMLINFRATVVIFGKHQLFKSKHLQRAHSPSDLCVCSHRAEIQPTDKYLLLENYPNRSASAWYLTIQLSFVLEQGHLLPCVF